MGGGFEAKGRRLTRMWTPWFPPLSPHRHPIIFTLLAFWSFIVAVIASTLTSDFNANDNAPGSEVNGTTRYLVFVGWWTFLFSIAYVSSICRSMGRFALNGTKWQPSRTDHLNSACSLHTLNSSCSS